MLTVSLRALVGALLVCAAGCASAARPLLVTDPAGLARAALGSLPGTASVGVLHADRPGYGSAGEQVKQSGELLFGIGSIKKVFTGVLLAQAVERGERRVDTTMGSRNLTETTLPPK